jgi:hypothetical protein
MRPVADTQIALGVVSTLSYQFTDDDGDATAPAGVVTIGVVDADGTVVVAPATATAGTGSDPRTYNLAAQTALGLLTATWSDAGDSSTHRQLVEVVGAFYFSVAAARAADTSLASTTKYPAATIIRARREVEAQCEQITGVAWVPRYRRARVDGTGVCELVLPDMALRSVRSVRVYSDGDTYTEFTADELAAIPVGDGEAPLAGIATRTDGGVWTAGRQNIVVEYEHGYDRPPFDLAEAAIIHLRHQLNSTKTGLTDRATAFQPVDGGNVLLATAGRFGFETGIPHVDAVYARYDHRVDGFA